MVSELQGPVMASTEANNQSTHTSPEPINNQSTHTNLNSPNTSASITPNPYFLNSSENPGNILVTQPLLGMTKLPILVKSYGTCPHCEEEDWFCKWKGYKARSWFTSVWWLGKLQHYGAFMDDKFYACGCLKQYHVLWNSKGDVDWTSECVLTGKWT